jgi:hypothetical protein
MLGEGVAFKQFAKHEMFFTSDLRNEIMINFVSQNEIMQIFVIRKEMEYRVFFFCETDGSPTKQPSLSSSFVFCGIIFVTKVSNPAYREPNHTIARKPGPL